MSTPLYRDMTEAERLAWGQQESLARQADLAADRSLKGLDRAKANARDRRRQIGATMSQATAMVVEANRAKRIAESRRSVAA